MIGQSPLPRNATSAFPQLDALPDAAPAVEPDDIAAPDASPAADAQADGDSTICFNMSIRDFGGQPIAGLKCRVVVGKETYSGTTDEQGNIPEISGLKPNEPLEILVKKTNGEYSTKYVGFTQGSDMNVCAVSPHIKVALETEPHEGEPDPAAATPGPTPAPAAAPVTAATAAPPPAQPAAPPQAPTATVAPNAPTAGQIAGNGKPPSKETQACRDNAGRPRLSIKERVGDWLHRNRLPTLGLWSPQDFKAGASGCTTPGVNDKAASGAKSPPAQQQNTGTVAGPKVTSLDQPVPPSVKTLIDIMEEQSTWQWDAMFKTDKCTSASIKADLLAKKFTPLTGKAPGKSDGRCYASVKVGLWRAGLVSGFNDDISAKGAGKWLLSQGFVDVTASVPDARWALPGDVIVYRYSDEKEEANRKVTEAAFKKYEKEKAEYDLKQAAYKKELSLWEAAMKERKLAKEEAKKNKTKYTGGADPKKPREATKPNLPDDKNYGHIDVRTYDGYISDFKRTQLPNMQDYAVAGIYRKISDPMPDLRLRAFLKVLREFECHGEPDDSKRYYLLNGGKSFKDVSTHPFESLGDRSNTAAGAYQILLGTYYELLKPHFGFKRGFTPLQQDRMATRLIEASKQSLSLIRTGKIEEAASILKTTWTSLPGGIHVRKKDGYVFTMNDLKNRYQSFLIEQIK
ncbi:hypothetical protein GCM10027277_23130 [Pseudoduganella ginsengisoli]|uniref:Glycoside hydrolase family protein n=1 Tax=Pseudoduganella ginsengisoli TaxID=1462440 RepID=A0A6L6Q6M3_9BURK|nr:glycoside hydrolase family protein [Pseudoduganella ginsengisoli]MTW05427.1 glycoside hydrolase family protein [Pseudoduganella ginsengisoli]